MGLLDNLFATPSDQAMFALGSGLFGVRRGNEGRAMMGALGAYNDAKEMEADNELRQLKIKAMQQQMGDPQLFGKIDPSDFTPESMGKFLQTKNYADLVLNPRNSRTPAQLIEWEHFAKLSPAEQERYMALKRAPGNITIGQVPHQVIGANVKPLSTLPTEAEAKATMADAGAAGAEAGRIRTQAQADLPAAENLVAVLKDRVKQLLSHPGRDYATGWKSVAPAVPGTIQYDFISRHNELRSKAFEQAFQTLKGGGPITEMEGKAATDALLRMDRATTSREYEAAAGDFIKAYEAGVQKIRNRANFRATPQMPNGYMDPVEQARAVRDLGIREPVNRVPDSDPLGIR